MIARLRKMLARAHKKSYTITVGKLNPAKLGNFLEIECFVLVACPENSVIEAKVSPAGFVLFYHPCHVRLASFDEERKGVRWTLTPCLT